MEREHDVVIEGNVFLMSNDVKYKKYEVVAVENATIDGVLVPETRAERPAPQPLPLLIPMGAEGTLGIGSRARNGR